MQYPGEKKKQIKPPDQEVHWLIKNVRQSFLRGLKSCSGILKEYYTRKHIWLASFFHYFLQNTCIIITKAVHKYKSKLNIAVIACIILKRYNHWDIIKSREVHFVHWDDNIKG